MNKFLYFKVLYAAVLMVGLAGCEQAGKKQAGSEPMRKIALCSAYQRPAAGQPPCADGRGIERMLALPRNVQSDAKPGVINYETWGIVLTIYVTERGLFFLPKPDDVKRSEIQTDTIFLHPTIPEVSDLDADFERRFKEERSPILDPEHKGRYVANTQRDSHFVVYEYRIGDREVGEGGPYPLELLRPKNGAPIFFLCGKPWMTTDRMVDPSCTVRDFGRRNLVLDYLLQRSQIRNWKLYSDRLWQYIDSHTIPSGAET